MACFFEASYEIHAPRAFCQHWGWAGLDFRVVVVVGNDGGDCFRQRGNSGRLSRLEPFLADLRPELRLAEYELLQLVWAEIVEQLVAAATPLLPDEQGMHLPACAFPKEQELK
ncbi:hypothetical protein CRG98_033150 [Punica granatum]|uniref:Uncharacterized protein n=1 Tax=Punica granatum TaxID=22663 RepID=A0A2I0IR31_PUNGR|nr:hypothetical protein CRG98_033150 [Punica granatum]